MVLGCVPVHSTTHRIFVLSNTTASPVSFVWDFNSELVASMVTIEPASGVLGPNEKKICHAIFSPRDCVALFEFTLPCHLYWEHSPPRRFVLPYCPIFLPNQVYIRADKSGVLPPITNQYRSPSVSPISMSPATSSSTLSLVMRVWSVSQADYKQTIGSSQQDEHYQALPEYTNAEVKVFF